MNRVEEAVKRFEGDYNCAQSMLLTYGTPCGLGEEAAAGIAGVFGGGMAGTGRVCGAVTGALMSLGLMCASRADSPAEGKEKAYEAARRFFDEFTSANGTLLCSELLGFDVGTPEGRELANRNDVFSRVCPGIVRSAASIFEKVARELA